MPSKVITQSMENTSSNLQSNLPSEEFMLRYLEKSKEFPAVFDKKNVQKEIVSRYKFRTQVCNDASYLTILEAEQTIDRNSAIIELQKYLGDFYLAQEMEKGLFEYTLTHITVNKQQNHLVSSVYIHHLITLCRNLDPNDTGVENKTLLPMIKESGLNPFFVPFFKPDQLHPERWQTIKEKKKFEEETEKNLATTDIYTCKKCKDKRFKITEIQIRSIDESSSKFCCCMTCGYTFII